MLAKKIRNELNNHIVTVENFKLIEEPQFVAVVSLNPQLLKELKIDENDYVFSEFFKMFGSHKDKMFMSRVDGVSAEYLQEHTLAKIIVQGLFFEKPY